MTLRRARGIGVGWYEPGASLEEIARSGPVSTDSMLSGKENLMTEKFHPYLSLELLIEDATSSRIDLDALPELARSIIGSSE